MEVVSQDEICYQHGSPEATDSTIDSESTDSNDDTDPSDEAEEFKEELQKSVSECYRSDLNLTTSENNDEEFQATALCQFMDILNDLDEVLDKSLLACLDEGVKSLANDDEDVICQVEENIELLNLAPSAPPLEELNERNSPNLARSKSLSDLTTERQIVPLDRTSTTEGVRGSMRRLDPIVLPAISTSEQLTLPVILFLEHHVNMRPTSAPIQLQVTTANLNSEVASGPLIVGRRALLMNRTLSLPSPVDSEMTGELVRRSTTRSMTRSDSMSTSSIESLNAIMPPLPDQEERNEESEQPPEGVWPHRLSAMLACMSCTVGVFSISRFGTYGAHYGPGFMLQFLITSLIFGIPWFTLFMCLGQVLQAGPVLMWKISPIFLGVGIAFWISMAYIGTYSMVGLSWVFVYLRDCFITGGDKYKWAMPLDVSFDDPRAKNATYNIELTVPAYFHYEVIQREVSSGSWQLGAIKFQVAFNLAVLWVIVFVALSRGLRSYGKSVYVLILIPSAGVLVVAVKLLTMIPLGSVGDIFACPDWPDCIMSGASWASAMQETFLTWGLLGVCVMQLTSHPNAKPKSITTIQKETACIVVFTFVILMLASILGNSCMLVLKNYGYVYSSGSYESLQQTRFLYSMSDRLPNQATTPARYLSHYASLVGMSTFRGSWNTDGSGWIPLELFTQIVPATLAALPANLLSPVWAVLFYLSVVMFGIDQQLAIWHCVVKGIQSIKPRRLKQWETTIAFLSCVTGLSVGILLSTDAGITLIHYHDFVCIGSWWHCILHVALCIGVFVVRGRPYSGEVVVAALYRPTSTLASITAALLSFNWNVILPIVICILAVVDFRMGQQKVLYNWKKQYTYWPPWARQMAVGIQQMHLLVLPVVAFLQTWKYLSKGPPDIFDRIQSLYRPHMGAPHESLPREPAAAAAAAADPPPKYTPPPSYSTATGARLLNTLRRSYRTLRRVTSSRPESATETSQTPITLSETVDNATQIPLASQPRIPSLSVTDETRSDRPLSTSSLAFTREFLRRSFIKSDSVKSIRSSLRRSFRYGGGLTTSNEHLVRDAEPISSTVAMSAMLNSEGSPNARSRASVI